MKKLCIALSHYLLISATLAFICGITFGYLCNIDSALEPLLPVITICLTALLLFLIKQERKTPTLAVTLTIVCLLGMIHGNRHLQRPADPHHISRLITKPTEAVITGEMESMAQFDGRLSRTTIHLHSIKYRGVNTPLPAHGNIQLSITSSWPETILPGDTILARVVLKPISGVRVPGVFNYESFQARRGIWVSGFMRSPLLIQKLIQTEEKSAPFKLRVERIRAQYGRYIDTALPGEQAALYRAILLGDRSSLDEKTLEIFKRCGTFHILAVSGLHLSILGGLLYLFFRWLITRSNTLIYRLPARKLAVGCTLPVLLGYAYLAGGNPPVLRALIMSCFVIIAICTNQLRHSLTLIALAALLIMVFDPLQLFSISFQLSFVAVMTIVLTAPLFTASPREAEEDSRDKIKKWLVAGCTVSIVAIIATAPLMLHGFNRISLIAPLANLIFEPLICFLALPIGLFSIMLEPMSATAAHVLLVIGGEILQLVLKIGGYLSHLPASDIRLRAPTPAEMFTYYSALILCFAAFKFKKILLFPGLLFLTLSLTSFIDIFPFSGPSKQTGSLRITYLDVGQGSSSLVELPEGKNVLIDGGSSNFLDESLGERVLAPFLWNKRIKKLDVIIISHPDADHFNGLRFVMRYIPTRELWIRDATGHNDDYRDLLEFAKNRGIKVVVPSQGTRIGSQLGYAEIVSSPAESRGERSDKNNSLVTKVCGVEHCSLFPGDIEAAFEEQLVNEGVDLRSQILLAPHHGSATSTGKVFLDTVAPELIVVSAGRNREGMFPARDLFDRCQERKISLLTTAQSGSIQIEIDSNGQRKIWRFGHKDNNPLQPMRYSLLSKVGTKEIPGKMVLPWKK